MALAVRFAGNRARPISQFSVIGTAPGRKAEKAGLLGQQTLTPRSGS